MATEKENFAALLHRTFDLLDRVRAEAPKLQKAYFDLGYNSGGSDVLVDLDLSGQFGFSAADVADAMNTLSDMIDFLGNTAVAAGDRSAVINKIVFGRK